KTDLWNSPVTIALRSIAAVNDGSRLNILGPIPYHSLGCQHPHLVADAPYEEYALRMFPEELAERSAEFKLFLAFEADSLGVEPSALSDIAETLASRAFRSIQMTDSKDRSEEHTSELQSHLNLVCRLLLEKKKKKKQQQKINKTIIEHTYQ